VKKTISNPVYMHRLASSACINKEQIIKKRLVQKKRGRKKEKTVLRNIIFIYVT